MAYTPIGWTTGDTITAEKLNRCDNGWSVSSTQLFSETVTTTGDPEFPEDGAWSDLAYSTLITADTLTVTFDGTEYTCPRIDDEGLYLYGGHSNDGLDFTEYPFLIESNGETNAIGTETGGTYTVSASVDVVECGAGFTAAVTNVNEQLGIIAPLKLVTNETTENEAITALESDRLVFFKIGTRSMYFVSYINTSTGIVSFIPDAAGVTAGFDGTTKLFYIGGN